MIGFANGAADCVMSPRPSAGNRTSGNSAVAGMGMASLIQNTAISMAAPAVRQPLTLRPSGGATSSVTSSASGPTTQPIHRRGPIALSNTSSSPASLSRG